MKKGITGDQILASTEERTETLLLGEYLGAGETMLLYAPTGQGKTINALSLCIALTTGGSFYNWKCHRPIKVLFVEGGELTAYGIAERARRIYKDQGITSDPNFHLKAPTKEDPTAFNITDHSHQMVLDKYIQEYGIECVVFDNFNSLRVEDDNEFQAWGRLEKWLNRLRTRKVASVIVHHTNKEAKQQSGAQRKADYCDLVVRIQKSRLSTKKGKWDTKGKVYIEFEMQKFRWGEAEELILTELVTKDGTFRIQAADYEQVLKDTIKRDLDEYGERYVNKKFDYLGYHLFHYLKDIRKDQPPERFESLEKLYPDIF
jgi:RecA-family ATPase